jgi:hypothetical protein
MGTGDESDWLNGGWATMVTISGGTGDLRDQLHRDWAMMATGCKGVSGTGATSSVETVRGRERQLYRD